MISFFIINIVIYLAVLMQAYRWVADSRDQFTKERLRALDDEFKVFLSVYCSKPCLVFTLMPSPRAAVPVPPDHELHQDVPEGIEPRACHREAVQDYAASIRVSESKPPCLTTAG